MPIPLSCDDCGARYAVPDSAAGKRLRCKACQAVLEVPEATFTVAPAAPAARQRTAPAAKSAPKPAARPVRRPRDDDEDDSDRDQPARRPAKKKSKRRKGGGVPGWVIAVGSIAAVVLVIIGVVTTILMNRSRPAPGGQAFAPQPLFGGPGGGLTVAGQEGPNTAHMRESLVIFDRLAATIPQIRDQPSMVSATATVRDTTQKMRDLSSRVRANPRMTPGEHQRYQEINQQYQPKVDQLLQSFNDLRNRARQMKVEQAAAQEFDRAWNEMTNAILALDRAFEGQR